MICHVILLHSAVTISRAGYLSRDTVTCICCMGTFDRSLMTSVVSREILICTKMRLKV